MICSTLGRERFTGLVGRLLSLSYTTVLQLPLRSQLDAAATAAGVSFDVSGIELASLIRAAATRAGLDIELQIVDPESVEPTTRNPCDAPLAVVRMRRMSRKLGGTGAAAEGGTLVWDEPFAEVKRQATAGYLLQQSVISLSALLDAQLLARHRASLFDMYLPWPPRLCCPDLRPHSATASADGLGTGRWAIIGRWVGWALGARPNDIGLGMVAAAYLKPST